MPVGVTWRRVAEYTGGGWVHQHRRNLQPHRFAYYTSVACNHCDNPICVRRHARPRRIWKRDEDGIVQVDASKCIGCRYCEWACPYGAPQFDAEIGVMTKCNFCVDYIDAGEPPACVAACPSRALEFGDIEELRAQHGELAEVAPLPEASITEPDLVIDPHHSARAVGSTQGKLANPEEV